MFKFGKDGGPKSTVWGYFFEIKKLFTVALLRFENGSREAYHSHAFDSISLILGSGKLKEEFLNGKTQMHWPGALVRTKRSDFHKVTSFGRTYVLTLRGPWHDKWQEYTEDKGYVTLTHGRIEEA